MISIIINFTIQVIVDTPMNKYDSKDRVQNLDQHMSLELHNSLKRCPEASIFVSNAPKKNWTCLIGRHKVPDYVMSDVHFAINLVLFKTAVLDHCAMVNWLFLFLCLPNKIIERTL